LTREIFLESFVQDLYTKELTLIYVI